jgi:KaiC/GvpD/RAD55 family RecA-like ATPase
MVYADTVRSQGLTEQIVESVYKDIAMADVETEYSKIEDTYLDEYNRQIEMNGISFQCPELDELTGGILDGQLCTVLGASGSMKTTYTSNIAYGAIKKGKNVLYLTLEESPYQLYTKWLSRASVDVGKPLEVQNIAQHKLDAKDAKVLEEEVLPYLNKQPGKVYFVGEQDLTSYSLNSLEAVFKDIDKRAQQETGKGIDLLVVDHIQLIKFAVTNMDPTTVINMYVSFFRQQSLSWLHTKRQIAVILLSQANRDGHTYAMKHDGAYLPQHVAEASEIVRAAAYIISVYTDAMVQVTKQLKVGAVKLRGSQLPTTTINVFADGAFYQVGDDVIPEQMDYSKMSSSTNSDYKLDDMFDTSIIDDLDLS